MKPGVCQELLDVECGIHIEFNYVAGENSEPDNWLERVGDELLANQRHIHVAVLIPFKLTRRVKSYILLLRLAG